MHQILLQWSRVRHKGNVGRFPFNQNVHVEFPATSNSKWNSVFQNFQNRGQPCEVYPNFRNVFPGQFSFPSFLLPEFPELSVEWFAFRKFNSFRNFWKYFGESGVPFPAVFQVSKVLVEWKAPVVNRFQGSQFPGPGCIKRP